MKQASAVAYKDIVSVLPVIVAWLILLAVVMWHIQKPWRIAPTH